MLTIGSWGYVQRLFLEPHKAQWRSGKSKAWEAGGRIESLTFGDFCLWLVTPCHPDVSLTLLLLPPFEEDFVVTLDTDGHLSTSESFTITLQSPWSS